MKLTKEEFAARINGREYRHELTKADAAEAKAAGLVAIFGASDDLLEFEGAISDEVGAYEGTAAKIDARGPLPAWDDLDKDDEADVRDWCRRIDAAKEVTAHWDCDGFSWVITTSLPHATFEIVEDGEKYCRGIVISIDDFQAVAS